MVSKRSQRGILSFLKKDLDLRTTCSIDICEYPDSGKVNILPYNEVFEGSSKVDYYKGEENPANKWPEEIIRKK
jgi:hypothetical protein